MVQDVVFFTPFKAREGLVTWVDRGGGAGKGTRGAEEDRRRMADQGFLIIGYIIIESPSYPIPTDYNTYVSRRSRDCYTRIHIPWFLMENFRLRARSEFALYKYCNYTILSLLVRTPATLKNRKYKNDLSNKPL